MESRDLPPPPHLLHRTNTELNLSVLRRYLPNIRSIISIAANAVVYTFAKAEQEWDKSGVEGTLLVCEQEPVAVASQLLPRACVFILNRRGLDNVIVDLASVSNCEWDGEFLMFQLEDTGNVDSSHGDDADDAERDPKVLGLWMHAAEQDDTREANATIIREAWRQIQLAVKDMKGRDFTYGRAVPEIRGETVGPAMQAVGRRLSLSELFGQRDGNETNG